ncbi:MAG: CoA pyrophosphatase [Pseudomonadota bacterium]
MIPAAWPIDRALIEAAVWSAPARAGGGDHDLNPGAERDFALDRARRPAAVLCALAPRSSGFHVILTRRAAHLSAHAGQIAFPGGKIDPGDPSPLAAALREAEEEIGLPREQVEVIGAIDRYETGTGFSVTPFVALAHAAFRPIADDGEVAEVFEAPLDFLMDPRNVEKRSGVYKGVTRHYYAYDWRGKMIWGATAGMLKGLADRVAAARAEPAISAAP